MKCIIIDDEPLAVDLLNEIAMNRPLNLLDDPRAAPPQNAVSSRLSIRVATIHPGSVGTDAGWPAASGCEFLMQEG